MRGKRLCFLGLAAFFLATLAPSLAGARQCSDHVRLGTPGISGTNAPPHLGYKLNLFSKYGIDLEPIYFQGGTALNQAVTAGDVQLELIAVGPALRADAVKYSRELKDTFRCRGKVFPTLPYSPRKGIRTDQRTRAERNPRVRRLQVENSVDDSLVKTLQESKFLVQVG